MIEKVMFCILTLILFIILFFKFIKRKDNIYFYVLACDLITFIIKFICIQNKVNVGILLNCIIYGFSIVIPLIIILLEQKNIYLSESICIGLSYINFNSGKNSNARKRLVKYVTKFPNSYYAHRLLAKIYESEGKDEEAIDEYVRAVELNKKDYDSYYEISFLLNKIGKIDESEEMLKNLLSKKPDYFKASILLGNILYDKEQFKKAVNVYLDALKYNPEIYELYYGLGMSYTRLNDFQTALEYYRRAAVINSMLYHARFNIAQINLITGELEKAENNFIECLQNKDTEPEAYYYLAIISLLKGEKERAVAYVNMAIELDSKIYNKVAKQEIFVPIIKEVRKTENKKRRYKYTYRELLTKKHLEDTFYLIEKMKANNTIEKNDNKAIKKYIEQYREY